jgi:hypothetical protein
MIEHEHALLGSILLDPAEIDVVAADVSAGDFSDRDLGQLFEALVTIHECGLPSGGWDFPRPFGMPLSWRGSWRMSPLGTPGSTRVKSAARPAFGIKPPSGKRWWT